MFYYFILTLLKYDIEVTFYVLTCLLYSEIIAIVLRTSKTLSFTSQLGSCNLLKSVGPISFVWLSESMSNAKLGGIKFWIASLHSFNAFTQI